MVDVNRAVRVLGCNLLKGLFSRCGSGENLLVSPYAAMVTLSLLMAGAQEDTEQELGEALQRHPSSYLSRSPTLTSAASPSPHPTTPPLRRSTRVRRPPAYLQDYETLPFSRERKMYR
ncbi:hypothetical protein MTO96_044202 [Rhipicephalus appendiculatus]